jgi:hypothetical protein
MPAPDSRGISVASTALPTLLDRLQTCPSTESLQSGGRRMRLFELFERFVHVGLRRA